VDLQVSQPATLGFGGKYYPIESYQIFGGSYLPMPLNINGRARKSEYGPFQTNTTNVNCGNFMIDYTGYGNLYAKGLGAIYGTWPAPAMSPNYNQLVYYKKGNELSGIPLVLGAENTQIETKPFISLYPQPARSGQLIQSIGIEPSGPIRLLLFDANGRQICSIPSEEGSGTSWKLPELSSGIYFYLLQNQNQSQIARGKLMIGQD
jgi:hypothetical protein